MENSKLRVAVYFSLTVLGIGSLLVRDLYKMGTGGDGVAHSPDDQSEDLKIERSRGEKNSQDLENNNSHNYRNNPNYSNESDNSSNINTNNSCSSDVLTATLSRSETSLNVNALSKLRSVASSAVLRHDPEEEHHAGGPGSPSYDFYVAITPERHEMYARAKTPSRSSPNW